MIAWNRLTPGQLPLHNAAMSVMLEAVRPIELSEIQGARELLN